MFDFLLRPFKRRFGADSHYYALVDDLFGFLPHNIELYKLALVHKSASVKLEDGSSINNERLEYLGDAVIETVVSDILYHHFPGKKEGFLTSMRSKIVQRSSLNRIAKETGLVDLIQSTHINRTHNSFIPGNAFEALVGAIYLDRGYAWCYRFFKHLLIGKHIDLKLVAKEDDNFKSKLIEWSQKTQFAVMFELVDENTVGTNSPTFRSRVCIEGMEFGTGFGYSKKESQQLAAKEAMRHIRKKDELYKKAVEHFDARTAPVATPAEEVQEHIPEASSEPIASSAAEA